MYFHGKTLLALNRPKAARTVTFPPMARQIRSVAMQLYYAQRAWAAGLDEGLLPLTLSNLLYMENPYSYKKCQWRITVRPRISTQATNASGGRFTSRGRVCH
jgi:hypothetical protein